MQHVIVPVTWFNKQNSIIGTEFNKLLDFNFSDFQELYI